jgi:hypothetical protein
MPLYPPRSQEPYKKKELLFKREQQLRHALSSRLSSSKVNRAAENVRAAQLMILKAEQELIRYDSEAEEKTRQLAAIEKKRNVWQVMPVEAIVQRYSASRASDPEHR